MSVVDLFKDRIIESRHYKNHWDFVDGVTAEDVLKSINRTEAKFYAKITELKNKVSKLEAEKEALTKVPSTAENIKLIKQMLVEEKKRRAKADAEINERMQIWSEESKMYNSLGF
jgi:hypothetical protein